MGTRAADRPLPAQPWPVAHAGRRRAHPWRFQHWLRNAVDRLHQYTLCGRRDGFGVAVQWHFARHRYQCRDHRPQGQRRQHDRQAGHHRQLCRCRRPDPVPDRSRQRRLAVGSFADQPGKCFGHDDPLLHRCGRRRGVDHRGRHPRRRGHQRRHYRERGVWRVRGSRPVRLFAGARQPGRHASGQLVSAF